MTPKKESLADLFKKIKGLAVRSLPIVFYFYKQGKTIWAMDILSSINLALLASDNAIIDESNFFKSEPETFGIFTEKDFQNIYSELFSLDINFPSFWLKRNQLDRLTSNWYKSLRIIEPQLPNKGKPEVKEKNDEVPKKAKIQLSRSQLTAIRKRQATLKRLQKNHNDSGSDYTKHL